jgi:ABC-2 type transport system permease protein
MMLTTGRYLHIDILSLLPLFVFTIAAPYGMGFMAGGIALIFKQIRALFQIVQFVFIGFIAAPVAKLAILKILPLSLGTSLIRRVMAEGISITDIPATDLGLLALNGAFYFGFGFFIFKICEKIARKRGLLGHY